MFLAPLRGADRWYRYHRLFRSVLRHRLEVERPGDARLLAQRAARWSLEQGDDDAAGHYLSAAEDWPGLLSLIFDRVAYKFEQGNVSTELRGSSGFGGGGPATPPRAARHGHPRDDGGQTLLAQQYLVDFEASDHVSPGDRAIALTLRASWVENHLGADATLAAGVAAAEALAGLGPTDLPPSGLTSLESLRSLVAPTKGRAELYRGDLGAAAEALDGTLERGIDYAPWAVNAHATRALVARGPVSCGSPSATPPGRWRSPVTPRCRATRERCTPTWH